MRRFNQWRRSESGNTLIIIAAGLPVLIILVGGAIDFSRLYMVRSKAQLAVDAGVIAAASSVSSQPPEQVVLNYLTASFPDNYMESSLNVATIPSSTVIGVVDAGDGTLLVNGTLSGTVKSYFLQLLGMSNLDFTVEAQAERGVRPMDLVLIADHSGSMCFHPVSAGGFKDASCPKLQSLKAAMTGLVNTFYGSRTSLNGVYVGIVPYATHVKYNTVPWWFWGASMDPRYGGNGMDPLAATNPAQTPIAEYTGSKATLLNNIALMNIDPNAQQAWTRTNVGLDAAWRMLRADHNAVFAHTTPAPRPFDGQTQKVAVLMTDGKNITYCPGSGPKVVNPDDNADTLDRCGKMKADGVTIYTVAFDMTGGDVDTLNAKNMLENCATNPTYYFDVANAAQLDAAFQQIADSLRTIRLRR